MGEKIVNIELALQISVHNFGRAITQEVLTPGYFLKEYEREDPTNQEIR